MARQTNKRVVEDSLNAGCLNKAIENALNIVPTIKQMGLNIIETLICQYHSFVFVNEF